MNKQKQTYLSPETETLVVRFEDSILQAASPTGEQFSGQSNWSGSGSWTDSE